MQLIARIPLFIFINKAKFLFISLFRLVILMQTIVMFFATTKKRKRDLLPLPICRPARFVRTPPSPRDPSGHVVPGFGRSPAGLPGKNQE